jgi:hypothetical protein
MGEVLTCKRCGFKTKNPNIFKRHLTKKSPCQNILNGTNSVDDVSNNKPKYICQNCDKEYENRHSKYYHQKKCIQQSINDLPDSIPLDTPKKNLCEKMVDVSDPSQSIRIYIHHYFWPSILNKKAYVIIRDDDVFKIIKDKVYLFRKFIENINKLRNLLENKLEYKTTILCNQLKHGGYFKNIDEFRRTIHQQIIRYNKQIGQIAPFDNQKYRNAEFYQEALQEYIQNPSVNKHSNSNILFSPHDCFNSEVKEVRYCLEILKKEIR